MKTQTRANMLKLIRQRRQTTAHELGQTLGISQVMVHRHLNRLLTDGSITRVGKPPRVFYIPTESIKRLPTITNLPQDIHQVIEENWLYVNPDGVILSGLDGFVAWARITGQDGDLLTLAKEYVRYRQNANKLQNQFGLVEAQQKLVDTFDTVYLDKVFYLDFYSLPKFGKTRLGTLVLQAKQTQSLPLIEQIAHEVEPALMSLVERYQVDTVGYIPHSIRRQVEFLPSLRQRLTGVDLPQVKLVKAYAGDVPVAQKSLSRLSERVMNARHTIFVSSRDNSPNQVLLLDDAVGSGATLNETAKKLKEQFGVKKVIGFAIVGSLKGFPVITEA